MAHKYLKIFNDLPFIRTIDEVLIYFTIYPRWSKKLIKKWTSCPEYDKEKDCSIYKYQIFKPFRKNLNKEPKYQKYSEWDNLVKDLLNNYPIFKPYFIHIKNFRNVSYL